MAIVDLQYTFSLGLPQWIIVIKTSKNILGDPFTYTEMPNNINE